MGAASWFLTRKIQQPFGHAPVPGVLHSKHAVPVIDVFVVNGLVVDVLIGIDVLIIGVLVVNVLWQFLLCHFCCVTTSDQSGSARMVTSWQLYFWLVWSAYSSATSQFVLAVRCSYCIA